MCQAREGCPAPQCTAVNRSLPSKACSTPYSACWVHQSVRTTFVDPVDRLAPVLETDPTVKIQPFPVVVESVAGAVNVATPVAVVVADTERGLVDQPVAVLTDVHLPVTVAPLTTKPPWAGATTVTSTTQVTWQQQVGGAGSIQQQPTHVSLRALGICWWQAGNRCTRCLATIVTCMRLRV